MAKLAIQLHERGSGPPLVILHHSTGPLWTPLHDKLADSFTVIAPDLPGYGESDRPDDARAPRDLAVYLSQLLDLLDLGPVHLVGAGLGGWVAAELATMNQGALASLALIGAAGVKPRDGFIYDPLMGSYEEYMRVGFNSPSGFEETFGQTPSPEVASTWDFSREMTARLTWKQWMWALSLPQLLQGVRTPTVVIWGAEDRVVPLDCGEQYAALLVNARLATVEGAGHLVELEEPDAVLKLIAGSIMIAS